MNKRLHIAHFTNTYHPFINGVVRSVSVFRQALTDLGHNIFIFAQYASHFEDTEPFIFRYPAIELPISPAYALPIPVSPFVDRLLPSLKLDVIHSHHPFLLGDAALRSAWARRLPLVFTHHTLYEQYTRYVPLDSEAMVQRRAAWAGVRRSPTASKKARRFLSGACARRCRSGLQVVCPPNISAMSFL